MTPQLEEANRFLRLAYRDRDTFDLLMPLTTHDELNATLSAILRWSEQLIEKQTD